MAYRTVEGAVEAEVVEKKSRFIAHLAHVETEEEALAFLDGVRSENQQARHNVYAYLLRSGRTRYSDDGEPAQTSGMPTFQVLERAGLADVICVTTRYFGGVLLGTGGLVRAYTQAAQAALAIARIVSVERCVDISVSVPYSEHDAVVRRIQEAGARVQGSSYSDKVQLDVRVLEADADALMRALTEASRGQAALEATAPFDAAF